MTDRPAGPGTGARRGAGAAVVTGTAAASAYGRGAETLLAGVLSGLPAFAAVQRFDVAGRRVRVAATMPGLPVLLTEVIRVVSEACDDACLPSRSRARTALFLAMHGDPAIARAPGADQHRLGPDAFAAAVARGCGLAEQRTRSYTSACVAASTAIADAAAMIARGRADRVVVAGGYLVESDQFALFDAGRVLADDGRVRPFSSGRRGLLLGDGVAAVVVESGHAVRARRGPALARIAGWGRAGDAYHACRPHPEGAGLARAIRTAMNRARIRPAQLGYVNAHGIGAVGSDAAETAALHAACGPSAARIPLSSTKSLHGHCLEASGLLELILTALVLRAGRLPANAGFLGPDPACRLDLVLGQPRRVTAPYGLSLNCAFGGANTALLVRTA